MTDDMEIINRALQRIGTRTTVTQTQYDNQTTNEAKQARLIFDNTRDDLLRMAPWDCAFFAANLQYITSVNGTPENQSAAPSLWQRGLPMPPWTYEYQYPVDCLRACYIIPGQMTGYSGGTPLYPVTTGPQPSVWQGPPIRFKVQTDTFYPVTSAAVVSGGGGYAVGDLIQMPLGDTSDDPIGAPVWLQVATLSGSAVATVSVVNQVYGQASTSPLGGSYFLKQTGTQTSEGGTVLRNNVEITPSSYATFTLTQGSIQAQRVILTNQQYATLAYIKTVTNPNLMDTLFQSAWISTLGAGLAMALSGDKALANMLVADANNDIVEARKADGNEGLTVNDVTPDWIRERGINYPDYYYGGPNQFIWGGLWPMY